MWSRSSAPRPPSCTRLGVRDYRILVVDDNSPDGTGQIADRLAQELDAVEVLHRDAKTGLGHAYLAGFAVALAGGAELVVEMDADFSHDPRYLGDLLEAAKEADLVLGSRYVAGGGVRDWGLLRRVDKPRRRLVCADDPAGRHTGSHRRLQMHPPKRARGDRPAERAGRGLRVPDRGHLPGHAGWFHRPGGADRVHRPDGGREQDVEPIALEAMWLVPRLRRTARAAIESADEAPSDGRHDRRTARIALAQREPPISRGQKSAIASNLIAMMAKPPATGWRASLRR